MKKVVIKAVGLSKSYGEKQALSPLDLTINAGEIFGLLGHNGAGKTTTVNLLTTLLKPSAGSLEVAGFDGSTNGANLRNAIGYLPENVQFYDNLTTMENLHFFARLSGLRKPEARIHEILS